MSRTIHVGVDWGWERHHVLAQTRDAEVLIDRAVAHDTAELAAVCDKLLSLVSAPDEVKIAIEVPHGVLVETFLERGFEVFSVNPKQTDRFRDRLSPAGAKDDRRDALVLSQALITDAHYFRRVEGDAPAVILLRELSRTLEVLKRDRSRVGNQLREALRRYYVQALELCSDLTAPWVLAVLAAAPTPLQARKVRPATIAAILKKHRIRKHSAREVLEILRQPGFPSAEGTAEAVAVTVKVHLDRLQLINCQIRETEAAVDAQLAAWRDDGDADRPHEEGSSDAEILLSLPGVGRIVAATLLTEATKALRARDYQALRRQCGIAPVTQASGKRRRVVMRQACHQRLREAAYHWARVSVQRDPRSKAKYAALRKRAEQRKSAPRRRRSTPRRCVRHAPVSHALRPRGSRSPNERGENPRLTSVQMGRA